MFFKNLYVDLIWTKVALALEGLKGKALKENSTFNGIFFKKRKVASNTSPSTAGSAAYMFHCSIHAYGTNNSFLF